MGRHAFDMKLDGDAVRPVAEVFGVQTIFINGVCGVDIIGSEGNILRIQYYVDGRTRLDGGPIEKVPVLEIIIPLADYILARGDVGSRLNAMGIKRTGDKDGCNG